MPDKYKNVREDIVELQESLQRFEVSSCFERPTGTERVLMHTVRVLLALVKDDECNQEFTVYVPERN